MIRSALLAFTLITGAAHAMEPVDVGEVRFAKAELTVVAPDQEHRFDQVALESLGTYAVTTDTPWRDYPAEFVGVRLTDLLRATGLGQATAIRVVAENDYAITMPREVWESYDPLIATRVDGRGHSRRARGPLQFVFDMRSNPATGAEEFQSNWVWMAARIEPVE